MFSDTKFWRLVWKEYRTQRALWLTLLIATPMLQVAFLMLSWVLDDFRPITFTHDTANSMMAIAFIASAVYLLGCCGTMFSVEHEMGTFDFQRLLPANQPQILWSKIGFAFGSTVLLSAALWIVTPGVLLFIAPRSSSWFGTYGLLYMAELFGWSILASLLIRQPLAAVIVAIAAQTVAMQYVLPYLTKGHFDFNLSNSDRLFLLLRLSVLLALVIGDIVLGKLWIEDRLRLPRWRFRGKPDIAPSYLAGAELSSYFGQRRIGWSRLLWLGWRDSRWMIAGLLMWFGYCWKATPKNSEWHELMLPYYIGSFVCGLLAFASEQWSGRFRFATERGCSPRIVWLSRHATWLPAVLLMTVVVRWLCFHNPQAFSGDRSQSEFEWAAALIGPFVCYSAGQFAAMLFRTTVVAFAVGLVLTILGIMWSYLMTSWLAPTWWAIGAWPVIGLFVTWLRAKDWIEERCDRAARWRLALGLGIPMGLLLATCVTYRAVQIPVVSLPAEWGENGEPTKLSAAETETFDIYRRAMDELDAGNRQRVAGYKTRVTKSRTEHSDWTDTQHHQAAFEGYHTDWLVEQTVVVPLLKEAHTHTAIPLALLQPDLTTVSENESTTDKTSQFSWLMVRHARETLKADQFEEAWQEIEVTFELIRRYRLRASPATVYGQVDSHEHMLQAVIVDWGLHPDQSRDRIVTAIRRYEQIVAHQGAVLYPIHWNMVCSRIMLSSDESSREFMAKTWYPEIREIEQTWTWKVWRLLPWEQRRSDRALRMEAHLAVQQAERLKQKLDTNQVISSSEMTDPGFDGNSAERFYGLTSLLPRRMTYGLSTGYQQLEHTATNRVTLLRLALTDWHREHGRYPESLNELVPTYFAEVPRDPHTAGPFVYFPQGVPEEITYGTEKQGNFRVIVKKDIPLIVMAGFGRGPSDPIPHQKPDGSWEFIFPADRRPAPLSEALKSAHVWMLEETPPSKL